MKLKSPLLFVLMFLTAVLFGAGPSITTKVSPTAICAGDTVTVSILTSDTFVTGNIFRVQLSDSSGSFATPVLLDSVTSQGNDTVTFIAPVVSKNSAHYKIRVVASNNTIGLDTAALTIHNTPAVTFQIPQPYYCTYAHTVPLAGGSPAGGVYSGTYVAGGQFQAYVSDTGSFEVYYTYTDSAGCFAEDSGTIHIISNCPSPSVSVIVNPAGICPGSNISVQIQTSDVLGSDNTFTVQLSDSSGSFATPTVLTTVSSASGDTINIPAPVQASGNHYKVRVIASDPSIISVPFNVAFKTLLAAPHVTLNTSGTMSLCTKDTFILKVDSVHGVSYNWTLNGNPFNVAGYKYIARDSGNYVIHFNDTTAAGCSSGADSVFIGIYRYPVKPVVSPNGVVKHCGGGTVSLSTSLVAGYTYQWLDYGHNISGATQTTYVADSTGYYQVKAVSHTCATKSDTVRVNIHNNPLVNFTLPFDSFCLHSAPIALIGGSPEGIGGFYSGNYVSSSATFNQSLSGVGAFKIYYTYIDSIGCVGKDSTSIHIYNCTTSGIAEVSSNPEFDMYPNPAAGKVNISVGTATNCKMKVFNLIGQQVGASTFTQQISYPVDKLPAGVYLVEVADVADSWKSVKRLVVQ